MSKRAMARRLATMLANGNAAEEARLYAHHARRTEAQVRESFARWCSISSTTQAEINRHCQFDGLEVPRA